MNREMSIGEEITVVLSESDLLDFVVEISEQKEALSNYIREAVLDSLAFDLGLAPNDFELHFVRNSELLDVIKRVSNREGLTVVAYIREAVIAVRDKIVSERYIQEIFERYSMNKWHDGQHLGKLSSLKANELDGFDEAARIVGASSETPPEH